MAEARTGRPSFPGESLDGAHQQLQSEDKAKLENEKGARYKKKGNYDKAKTYYLKTEQMIIKHEKISLSVVVDTYLSLGACELEVFEKAIIYYNKCLDWIKKLKESAETQEVSNAIVRCYNGIGNCYLKQEDFVVAAQYYKKCMDHLKSDDGFQKSSQRRNAAIRLIMANTHNNLGICFMTNESLALSHFNKSLEIKKKLFGKAPCRSVARTYNNLGRLYMEMKQYTEAIDYHTMSLEMKIERYGDVSSILSIDVSYQNMGECYQAMGDEKEASYYFKKGQKVSAKELLQGDFF